MKRDLPIALDRILTVESGQEVTVVRCDDGEVAPAGTVNNAPHTCTKGERRTFGRSSGCSPGWELALALLFGTKGPGL